MKTPIRFLFTLLCAAIASFLIVLALLPPGNVASGAPSVAVCLSSSDCSSGQVCEDGICVAPGCGSNFECGAGQICSGGDCVAAPTASQVISCDVTPNPAQVEAGSTVALKALALDSAGRGLPFAGFTWSVTGPATVSQNGVVTGTGSGVATIVANAGNSTSCTATVTTFPPIAAGQLRVVVIDADTKLPIESAVVVVDGTELSSTTDLQGQVTAAVGSGPHDVHVFASAHDYVSILNTMNADLLVPLSPWAPLVSRPYFQGTMSAADFTNLSVQGESVHVAFFGSSIPGSPLDISLPTLLGPLSPTTNLPAGLVNGIGQNMFTDQYKIYAPAGKRVLWGFGGNLSPTVLSGAPLLSGNSRNIDQVLSQLLPSVGKLQAGTVRPVEVNSASSPIATSVPLNTRLRLRVTPTMPRLPLQDGKYLGGAVVIGGALDYPLGFVPLGITEGVSQTLRGETTGWLLDPTCDISAGSDPCATGKLPMRLAPQGNGLEGASWAFLSLASNLNEFSDTSLSLSALVKTAAQIPYVAPPAPGTTIDFTARAYMNLPSAGSVKLTRTTRSFTISADADASTKMYRFRLSNHAHLNWNVWMPSTTVAGRAIAVTLPDPSTLDASLVDPLQDAIGDDGQLGGPSALLVSVSTGDGSTYDTVTGFATPRLDQLGTSIDAFTLVSVPIQ
jgi:hypothetical protein